LEESEKKVRYQETDFFENAEVTVFGLNEKIQALSHREETPFLLYDQPATAISGKLL
jgi:hypothetical protein